MELDLTLFDKEGWKVRQHNGRPLVITPYEQDLGPFTLKHPALIHLEVYRKHGDADTRYRHMKAAHDYLWPETIWHEWTERRFRAHCDNYNYITLAAGASASKSYDIAKVGILFWYANPKERNVTIASVTLASLMTRVWGYLTAHIKSMARPLPYKYYRSNPPRILYEEASAGKNKIEDDTLHGIFAVTARVGDDDQAIATWIGKHPKDKIMLILDECTDMPMTILNATPNLNSHPEKFQLIGIGNSNSTLDLHGILSTPAAGWDSVSIELQQWPTTQINGTCLYFSPYDSPAVKETDLKRRRLLERFLIGEKTLKDKEAELGTDSEKFYRWVLGFWKSRSLEDVTVTEAFLADKDFYSEGRVEWSGFYPLQRVASLDPAFSTDGDKCLFRVGAVGHSIEGKVKIDLGIGLHEIKLYAVNGVSLEKQVGVETVKLMKHYRIPITSLTVDVTGQGRAIAEVIVLLNQMEGYPLGPGAPLKIYSMSYHNVNKTKKAAPDIVPLNSYLLWNELRSYLEQNHVAGIDDRTRYQLTNRRILAVESKGKKAYRLESKLEYKRRMSALGNPHSPDEADTAALIIQGVKRRLGIEPGTVWKIPEHGTGDRRTQERMIAFLNQDEMRPMVVTIPEADFAGSLESYAKNFKPF